MTVKLLSPQPPRLPDPPDTGYNAGYFNLLLKTLRVYFAQLGNATNALLGNEGATYLQTVYGEFASTQNQTIVSTTTAYVITYDTTVLESGVTLVSGSRLTVTKPGIYKLTVELQFANTDTSIRTTSIWVRKNGVDVPFSRARYAVTEQHGGTTGRTPGMHEFYISMQENDYVEAVWYANSVNVFLEYGAPAASPTRPSAPSAIAALFFVSAETTL